MRYAQSIMVFVHASACVAFTQTLQSPPVFEVASVKRLDPARVPLGATLRDGPARVDYPYITIGALMMRAYSVLRYQIVGPAWIDKEGYEVLATLPSGASQDQIPAMLQDLLADRFGLAVHRESRIRPVYVLVRGDGEVKLRKSDDQAAPTISSRNGTRIPGVGRFSTRGHLEFSGRTVTQFAQALSGFLDRPVIDITNVQGKFDIVLDVKPDDLAGLKRIFSSPSSSEPDGDGLPSIFTAIRGLGLRLEPRQAPIEHIIVDQVEKVPTQN